MRITASILVYKNQKCLYLSMHSVQDYFAQTQLMFLHSEITAQFLENFRKDLQSSFIKEQKAEMANFSSKGE